MTARTETLALMQRFTSRGINLDYESVNILRRAEKVLHRWGEDECGNGNDYGSWHVDRDEKSGIPFMNVFLHNGRTNRYRIADREKGALNRVQSVCKAYDLFSYHQTDPRGCSLYISNKPINDVNYTNGVSCCD